MTTWRIEDGSEGWLAAALREIGAKQAAIADDAVHYAPGDSPLCGEDVVDALCTHEPEAMAGCIPCLELVAEDLTDDNTYMGRCLHCQREIHTQGGVEWRGTVRSPCPHCGMAGW